MLKKLIPLTSFCFRLTSRLLASSGCHSCLLFCCAESPQRSPKKNILLRWKIVFFSLSLASDSIKVLCVSRILKLQFYVFSGSWVDFKSKRHEARNVKAFSIVVKLKDLLLQSLARDWQRCSYTNRNYHITILSYLVAVSIRRCCSKVPSLFFSSSLYRPARSGKDRKRR